MEQEIIEQLKTNLWFRERKNKNAGIASRLMQKYNLTRDNIEISRLRAIIEDANSMDRYWRKALQENPELRGQDYDTKRQVEELAQMNLGYESGFHESVKKLKQYGLHNRQIARGD